MSSAVFRRSAIGGLIIGLLVGGIVGAGIANRDAQPTPKASSEASFIPETDHPDPCAVLEAAANKVVYSYSSSLFDSYAPVLLCGRWGVGKTATLGLLDHNPTVSKGVALHRTVRQWRDELVRRGFDPHVKQWDLKLVVLEARQSERRCRFGSDRCPYLGFFPDQCALYSHESDTVYWQDEVPSYEWSDEPELALHGEFLNDSALHALYAVSRQCTRATATTPIPTMWK